MDIEDIDIERLRKDLYDFFATAYFNVSPVAVMDIIKIEYASDMEIINIAIKNGFDLGNYLKNNKRL